VDNNLHRKKKINKLGRGTHKTYVISMQSEAKNIHKIIGVASNTLNPSNPHLQRCKYQCSGRMEQLFF
jgi:hypothetical protein